MKSTFTDFLLNTQLMKKLTITNLLAYLKIYQLWFKLLIFLSLYYIILKFSPKLETTLYYYNLIISTNLTMTQFLGLFISMFGLLSICDCSEKNKFIESINFFPDFNHFFSQLSVFDSIVITNLIGCFTMLSCISSIIFLLFGDKLIEYFNLRNKHKLLTRIIELRDKFKNYYLVFNIIVILFVILGMMYLDVLYLVKISNFKF